MSVRKAKVTSRSTDKFHDGNDPQDPRKKTRGPRVHLTHFEVRRNKTLRLRIAVADDALADVGDELGALIKRIAPSTRIAILRPDGQPAVEPDVQPVSEPSFESIHVQDFNVSRAHVEHDASYHAELREHLVGLFSTLCDTSLDDALDVARRERDRRADGGN